MNMNITSYNANIYRSRSFGSQTAPVGIKKNVVQTPEEKKEQQKKIMIGAGIAGGLLLLGVIFRKNVKKLFSKAESITKEVTPIHPEVRTAEALRQPEVPKPIEPASVKPAVPEFDGEKTMAEYRELVSKQKPVDSLVTEEDKALWNEQNTQIRKLRLALKENNVSFVQKEKFSPDPTKDVEAKRAYLISSKVGNARVNEASKLDYLEMFDKYGGRYWINQETRLSSLRDVGHTLGSDNSDKVMGRYIDIMDKWAQRDPEGMRDAVGIITLFENNAHTMSKKTALKFIKVLKRTSFQQQDGLCAENALNSPLQKVKYKDDPEVRAALADYQKSLEVFPYRDRTHND